MEIDKIKHFLSQIKVKLLFLNNNENPVFFRGQSDRLSVLEGIQINLQIEEEEKKEEI
jgi:hypothetical protein